MRHKLIGTYPPPLGGVSVFLYRHRLQLLERGEQVEVLDLRRRSGWRKWSALAALLLDPRPTAFDLNELNFNVMALLALRPFAGPITYRIHGFGLHAKLRGVRGWVLQAFLRRADRIVLVNPALRAHYEAIGHPLPPTTDVEVAFLPPPLAEEAEIRATYDAETRSFVESRRPLLVANAFRLTFDRGVDLYGFDLCVALIDELRSDFPNAGLLLALAEVGEPDYFASLRDEISRRGLDEHVHFMTGQRQLWPLLRDAAVLLRPTTTDGDAISIREALLFDRPVVASDVVERPAGTELFRSRDLAAFVAATRRVLSPSAGGPG